MSKGSKVVLVRMAAEELKSMLEQIDDSNGRRSGEPWTVSEFIRIAIREKLAKMERSRSGRRRCRAPLGDSIVNLTKGGA